uniref:Putative zinc/iron transporter n=1 Tax=Ixodes ricinus TaxID=34613 RepID=A0A131XU89_IXORI
MELEAWKLFALVGLFALTLAMVFLPLFFWGRIRRVQDPHRRHVYETGVSLLSCFGGGVFLATCLLHLLPEARSQLDKGLLERWGHLPAFPLLEFLCILGLLLVLVMEQVTLSWKEGEEMHHVAGRRSPHHTPLGAAPVANYGSVEHLPGDWTPPEEAEEGSHSIHDDPNSHSTLRALVLVLSLSLHSVFEGIALGLQPDGTALAQLLAAIAVHKSVLAVTLGLNLAHSRLGRAGVAVCGLTFAAMAPFGMGLAMLLLLGTPQTGTALLEGVLQGLACGTFLYVTFFEVLPHEMNHSRHRLAKLLAVLLGVAAVTALCLSFPHS